MQVDQLGGYYNGPDERLDQYGSSEAEEKQWGSGHILKAELTIYPMDWKYSVKRSQTQINLIPNLYFL